MYARSSPNAVYDLLGEDGQHTLCGLTLAPIVIDSAGQDLRAPSDDESTSRRRIVYGLRED